MEIIDYIPVNISVEQVLRRLHLDKDGKYAGDVQGLIDIVQPLIRPKAVYDVCYIDRKDSDSVEIGGVRFTSRVLRVNLDQAEEVFPYVATCGRELDAINIPTSEMMRFYFMDQIKEMVTRGALNYLHDYLKERHAC